MKKSNYEGQEKIELIGGVLGIIGFLALIYSIIAGIWNFNPIEYLNLKIAGTSIILIFISYILFRVNQEM